MRCSSAGTPTVALRTRIPCGPRQSKGSGVFHGQSKGVGSLLRGCPSSAGDPGMASDYRSRCASARHVPRCHRGKGAARQPNVVCVQWLRALSMIGLWGESIGLGKRFPHTGQGVGRARGPLAGAHPLDEFVGAGAVLVVEASARPGAIKGMSTSIGFI